MYEGSSLTNSTTSCVVTQHCLGFSFHLHDFVKRDVQPSYFWWLLCHCHFNKHITFTLIHFWIFHFAQMSKTCFVYEKQKWTLNLQSTCYSRTFSRPAHATPVTVRTGTLTLSLKTFLENVTTSTSLHRAITLLSAATSCVKSTSVLALFPIISMYLGGIPCEDF